MRGFSDLLRAATTVFSRYAPFARFCRATNRSYSARGSGSELVLESGRAWTEARGLPNVLQPVSVSHRTGRTDTRAAGWRTRTPCSHASTHIAGASTAMAWLPREWEFAMDRIA